MIGKVNQIQPFLVLNISFLEMLGLVLPILTGLFLFYYIVITRKEYSGLPPIQFILIIFLLIFFIALIPLPEIEEETMEYLEENVTTTIITTQIPTTSHQVTPSQPDNPETFIPDPHLINFLTLFISELRNIFLLGIFILTIVFLLILRRQSKIEDTRIEEAEDTSIPQSDKSYYARTILECYYQASTSLEERGADNSPALTPPEFTNDVTKKKLCPNPPIRNLTELFEEAKFSKHQISADSVNEARKFAQDIIIPIDTIANRKKLDMKEDENE